MISLVNISLYKTFGQSLSVYTRPLLKVSLNSLLSLTIFITIKMNKEINILYNALLGQQGTIITEFKVKVPQAGNGISPNYKITMPQCISRNFIKSDLSFNIR